MHGPQSIFVVCVVRAPEKKGELGVFTLLVSQQNLKLGSIPMQIFHQLVCGRGTPLVKTRRGNSSRRKVPIRPFTSGSAGAGAGVGYAAACCGCCGYPGCCGGATRKHAAKRVRVMRCGRMHGNLERSLAADTSCPTGPALPCSRWSELLKTMLDGSGLAMASQGQTNPH